MAQTYYEILGVAENATAAEIEAAFKAKAREVHPDTVPAENAYLRKVAAEAFKDLSEAKAVLLDPVSRQKYDAGLVYARGTQQSQASPAGAASGSGPSSGPTPPSQSSTHSRSSTNSRASGRSGTSPWGQRHVRSRTGRSGTQAAIGVAQRARRTVAQLPDIKNLNSFLFMILGVATIFFLVALVSSGRVPPLWLAIVTACLGILSFMNGMRPNASTISSGRTALVLSAILVVVALASLWALSPSYLEIAIAHRAEAAAAKLYKSRNAPRPQPAASHIAPEGPTVAVVDESAAETALPTKIWSNLKDGQNYRTRLNGDALSLEAIGGSGNAAGQITSCEFHHTAGGAPNWVGICSERASQGETERKSMASLSQFSDTQLEGSTGDIPVFLMTPVDGVQMATPAVPVSPQIAPPVGPPAEGEILAEPDLSGLSDADRESIEGTCASDKLTQGQEKYKECVRRQMDALKQAPRPAGLSRLNSGDRDKVEFACTDAKLMQGPAAYNRCLAKQMAILKKRKP
jgi:DnaJ domain